MLRLPTEAQIEQGARARWQRHSKRDKKVGVELEMHGIDAGSSHLKISNETEISEVSIPRRSGDGCNSGQMTGRLTRAENDSSTSALFDCRTFE